MVIQTLGKNYTVIQYCYSDSNIERFLCKIEGEESLYTVVCIKNREWIMTTVEFLMKQKENFYFTDFIDCFTGNEFLYIVMKYARGISLEEKLKNESCSRVERLAMGRALLEHILVLKIPDYFLQDALSTDLIVFVHGMELAFRYELAFIHEYETFDFARVQEKLYKIFQLLLEEELKKETLAEAMNFCLKLKNAEFETCLEVYTAYRQVIKQAEAMSEEDFKLPKTLPFRLWERIKGYLPLIKRMCAIALMMAAIVFLIYTCRKSLQDGREKKSFDSIGTLQIEEEKGK